MTKEEVLQNCTVEGFVVKLPNVQLDRKLYLEVAKSLELIGGKWKGGKVFGFTFAADPTELLSQISNGEKKNLKKEFQFFETPELLADKLVELAEIKDDDDVLEPSAGQGAIVKAIHRKIWDKVVCGYELMEINHTFLNKISGLMMFGYDFLTECHTVGFDKIIANPPFSKNQDIDHIYKMYDCLKDGGRIVTIASKHWQTSTNKKETEFRNWLTTVGAEIQEIPAGTFKESGTMVGSVIIVINKYML